MLVIDAHKNRVPVIVSAATLVEVITNKTNLAALQWAISKVRVVPVSKGIALAAATLLKNAGLHGQQHTVDAIVCATALAEPGHATIFTSDPTDIKKLVNGVATVVTLR